MTAVEHAGRAEPGADAGTTDRCVLGDPAVTDREDPEVVPAALRHLRDVARHTCRIVAVNGFYPPGLAVDVLVDTTAALTELAHHIAPYVGDFWPPAGARVTAAGGALVQARTDLDAARHHTTLTPADDQPAVAVA